MNEQSKKQLAELLFCCLEGDATPQQEKQLEALLRQDPEAITFYGQLLVVYAGLSKSKTHTPSDREQGHDPDPVAVKEIDRYAREQLYLFMTEQENLRRQEAPHYRARRLPPRNKLDWRQHSLRLYRWTCRVLIATAAVAIVGLFVATAVRKLLAQRPVARLEDSRNAIWESPLSQRELRAGTLHLKQGFAQIRFNRGAQILVQAPCSFTLLSTNRMALQSGQVCANVPTQAVGFTIESSGHEIVDFGTEFGVAVDTNQSMEVEVFLGEIRMQGLDQSSTPVTSGQIAQLNPEGLVTLYRSQGMTSRFMRELPDVNQLANPGERLDLADVVGRGNGFGTGLPDYGWHPATGHTYRLTHGPHGFQVQSIDSPFLPLTVHPFIDGFFIPDAGRGQNIISTTGLRFMECPDTTGEFHGTVNNCARTYRNDMEKAYFQGRLGGVDCGTSENPVIMLHTNSGITFDLAAVRQRLPRTHVVAFTASCGISETSRYDDLWVDFWVLVDGQQRFHAAQSRLSSPSYIRIPIQAEDRFLSLTTTDQGRVKSAWALFVRPILLLQSTDHTY